MSNNNSTMAGFGVFLQIAGCSSLEDLARTVPNIGRRDTCAFLTLSPNRLQGIGSTLEDIIRTLQWTQENVCSVSIVNRYHNHPPQHGLKLRKRQVSLLLQIITNESYDDTFSLSPAAQILLTCAEHTRIREYFFANLSDILQGESAPNGLLESAGFPIPLGNLYNALKKNKRTSIFSGSG